MKRSPVNGWFMTPRIGWSPCCRPMSVPHVARPEDEVEAADGAARAVADCVTQHGAVGAPGGAGGARQGVADGEAADAARAVFGAVAVELIGGAACSRRAEQRDAIAAVLAG